jgi:hypothetical protein
MVVVGSEGEFDVVIESAETPEPVAVATAARPVGTL